MVSTRKKNQSNRNFLSQLDDFDQDLLIGNATNNRQENTTAIEGTSDQELSVGKSDSVQAVNEIVVNVKTLERCFNERIDREMGNIVDTVEDRLQKAIMTTIDSVIIPKIELALRSINAWSGREATSGMANSERGEHIEITAPLDNVSERNNTLHVLNLKDESRNKIADKTKELSVPGTRFDRQQHTHHMVTGQTSQTNQIPGFLTGWSPKPREQESHHYHKLSTQVSNAFNLPMVAHAPENQNSDSNICSNPLVEAIFDFLTQKRPKAATMLKPVSSNTLILMTKTRNLNSSKNNSRNAQYATRTDRSNENRSNGN